MPRARSRAGILLLIAVIVAGTTSTLVARPQTAHAVCFPSTTTPTAPTPGPTETASPAATPTATSTATPTATSTATATATETSALIGIISGTLPPLGGGFGTFSYCGGTFEELLQTTECPVATATFFFNKPDGTWAVWIPGATVAAVNAEIKALFPSAIPAATIFTARCTVGTAARTEDEFARSLLLTTSDLPKGWLEQPPSTSSSSGPNPLAPCFTEVPYPTGLAARSFNFIDFWRFTESLALYGAPGDANAAVSARQGFAECMAAVLRSGAFDDAQSSFTAVTVVPLALPQLPAGGHASRIGFKVKSRSASGTTSEVSGSYDIVYFANGRVAVQLITMAILLPWPAQEVGDMVQRANAKVRQQPETTSAQSSETTEGTAPLDETMAFLSRVAALAVR